MRSCPSVVLIPDFRKRKFTEKNVGRDTSVNIKTSREEDTLLSDAPDKEEALLISPTEPAVDAVYAVESQASRKQKNITVN